MTHLVSNEQPLAIAPALHKISTSNIPTQYASQPSLNNVTPVYSNILTHSNSSQHVALMMMRGKSQSYSRDLNVTTNNNNNNNNSNNNDDDDDDNENNNDDLQLDSIVIRDPHIDKRKSDDVRLDNDLTLQEKENSLLSASRLRLLQDTTMIESALDLDSLDDSSLGTNSQVGLMKVV